jgi:hypothetical protein
MILLASVTKNILEQRILNKQDKLDFNLKVSATDQQPDSS